jgi:predicted adenylyl cyclase CyaB
MKQIEITTYVNNTLQEVDDILKRQGFKVIRKSKIKDIYKTLKYNELNKNNILNILSESVLIRYLKVNDKDEYKKLTYKNKIYDNDIVISEEKINVTIDDINKMNKLLELIGLKTIVNVNYDVIVYSNDDIEFCFQSVGNLGLLLEYENKNDYDGYTNEEILSEKFKMLKEIQKYGLNISNDIDVKKAFELIKHKFLSIDKEKI